MRRKVLLISSMDLSRPFDRRLPYTAAMKRLGNNSGNLLFSNAVQQYLTNDAVDLTVSNEFTQIDERYDLCIICCANWVDAANRDFLKLLADVLGKVKIPVYCLGLGAQASATGRFEFLDAIRDEAKAMIAAVLHTGGGFGLRGAFTGEVFERLGFRDFTVIGCPSIYNKGRDLKISNDKVDRKDFKPLLNGKTDFWDEINAKTFRNYPHSEFICQDEFYKFLYCPSEITDSNIRSLLAYPEELLVLLRDGRVRLYNDMPSWLQQIREDGFTFSFGNRIHGNIVAILAGIPAFIQTIDSRTAELANFFSIPSSSLVRRPESDLYDLYLATDYSEFNRNFPARYDQFCAFLQKHNLPLKPGPNEAYKKMVYKPNDSPRAEIGQSLKIEIDRFLNYSPNKLLFALRPHKQFWYRVSKKVKGLA